LRGKSAARQQRPKATNDQAPQTISNFPSHPQGKKKVLHGI